MLSRVANSIYWMSRYLERAENVARFIAVNVHLMLDLGLTRASTQWEPLVITSGDEADFHKRYREMNEKNVIHFLTFDQQNPNSILSCINAARENAAERVKEILGGLADVTIDGTGNPKVIETAYDLAKLRGGRCVLFGVMPSDQRVSIHTLPLHFGRVLTGSEGGQSRPEIDIPEILRRLAAEKLDVSGFVSHRGLLVELPVVIDGMRRGEVIHAIVRPG
jgi:hypothetical protein